jgi:hypothetical protein
MSFGQCPLVTVIPAKAGIHLLTAPPDAPFGAGFPLSRE